MAAHSDPLSPAPSAYRNPHRPLGQLRHREVIRSGNAPAGDYASCLCVSTGGELAPDAQKTRDVLAPDGERLQMKARVVTNPRSARERQLSVFRAWDFDAAVVVLFDDEFRVWRATRLSVARVEKVSRFVEHVKGYRVIANDALLEHGEDWTELLRQAADDN